MRIATVVALILISLACWLVPIQVLAQETGTTKTLPEAQIEIKEEAKEPTNAIQTRTTEESRAGIELGTASQVPVPSVPTKQVQKSQTTGRHYSKEEVHALIVAYSEQYGIDPEVPLCIAKYESGYNQFSKNNSSSASGVFQYLAGTWKSTDEGKAGYSVFQADKNILAAIKYMTSRKNTTPWVVANKCPSLTFTK